MNRIMATILIGACLAGCAREMPVTDHGVLEATTIVTGYSSDGELIVLMKGNRPVTDIPRPDDADRLYVSELSDAVRNAVVSFIGQPDIPHEIVAARTYGSILLLDVAPTWIDDGNIHIVYDLEREEVIGRFVWYLQG